VKFVQEKALIGKFFEEIALDTRKYCYGIRDVLYAIDSSAVLTLIVFENLDINRIVVRVSVSCWVSSFVLISFVCLFV
jgi:peptide chain release factor subunit 1